MPFFFNPLSLSSLPSPLLSPPLPALRSQVNPLPSARSPRSYLRLLLDPTFLSRPSSSRARYAGSPCPRPSSAGRRGESLCLRLRLSSPGSRPDPLRRHGLPSPLYLVPPRALSFQLRLAALVATGRLNLRPINLDKLNEGRPAFDARVNREFFYPHSTRSRADLPVQRLALKKRRSTLFWGAASFRFRCYGKHDARYVDDDTLCNFLNTDPGSGSLKET